MWSIEHTDEFESWWGELSDDEQERPTAAVELLEQHGPSLGRPSVDSRRTAILLCGGDKRGQWSKWYAEAIPAADRLFDDHLQTIANEGPTDGSE